MALNINKADHKTAYSLARAIGQAIGGDRGHIIERSLEGNVNPEQMVRAFHAFYDVPAPSEYTELTPERLAMRIGLVLEEFGEFLFKAMGISMEVRFEVGNTNDQQEVMEDLNRRRLVEIIPKARFFDPVEGSDAAGDSVYVWFGLMIEMGISLMPVLREIHAANMTKPGEDGSVLRRLDGKVMKGPYYMEPNIAQVLSACMNRGLTSSDYSELHQRDAISTDGLESRHPGAES